MNGGSKDGNPGKILVATDGSHDAASAVHRAAGMARYFGAELFLVHVVPVSSPYRMAGGDFDEGPSLYEEDTERARALLDEQARMAREDGVQISGTYLKSGEPAAEVVALAETMGADLIVAGGRGMSPMRRPIGSVSGSIAAHAHCPVLVVRDTNGGRNGAVDPGA